MKLVIGLSALMIVAAAGPDALAQASSARDDAAKWISFVDSGHYDQSWSDAGALFKAHISQIDWSRRVTPTRQPLGAVITRKLKDEQEATSLPGTPDGHYKILQFDTDFQNKRSAIETIILAEQPDGWKVDGYFIR